MSSPVCFELGCLALLLSAAGMCSTACAQEAAESEAAENALLRGCLFAYYPSAGEARVGIDFDRSRVRLPGAVAFGQGVEHASVSIVKRGSDKTLATAPLGVRAGKSRVVSIDLPDLNGHYEARYTLRGAHGTREFVVTFERLTYPWEGNSLGVTDEVYPPFEPVEADQDGTVKIVGRTYRLDGLGMPKQIEATGIALLHGPTVVRYRLTSGEEGVIESGPPTLQSANRAGAIYTGQGLSSVAEIRSRATVEFDGMVKVEWTFAPGRQSVEIERMWLEIPMRRETATLMHNITDGNRVHHAGATPEGDGVVWTSSQARRHAQWQNTFNCYLWLGQGARGLAWFGENDRGWLTEKGGSKAPIQQVVRDGDAIRLEVSLVNTPARIEREHQVVFGIQASPTKPRVKGWRAQYPPPAGMSGPVNPWGGIQCAAKWPYRDRWEVVDQINLGKHTGSVDQQWFKDFAKAHNAPLVHGRVDWVERTLYIAKREARLPKDYPTFTYFEEMRASPIRPEWQTFQDEWGVIPFTARQWPTEDVMRHGFNASPNVAISFQPSYQDYGLYYANEWLKRGVGLYWDNTYPQPAYKPFNTAAYTTDDGATQPAMSLFNQRAYQKRIWNLLQAHRKTSPVPLEWSVHMTSTLLLPLHTFATVQLDHEFNLAAPVPPDCIRTTMTGLQCGNLPHALFELSGKVNPKTKPLSGKHRRRIEWGMRRVHEIVPGPGFADTGGPLEAPFRSFGYGREDIEVHHYWDDGLALTVDQDDVKWITLYDPKADRGLVVLSSWDHNEKQAGVVLGDRFTSTQYAFLDAETGVSLGQGGRGIKISLPPPYGTRVVLAVPAGEKHGITWSLRTPKQVAADMARPDQPNAEPVKGPAPSAAPEDVMRDVDPGRILFADDFSNGLSAEWTQSRGVEVVQDGADAEGHNRFARITQPGVSLQSPPIRRRSAKQAAENAEAMEAWGDYALRFRFRVGSFVEDTDSSSPLATFFQLVWRHQPTLENAGVRQTAYIQLWRENRAWRLAGPYVAWNGRNESFALKDQIAKHPQVGQVDTDWHEVEVRVVGDRTQIRLDDQVMFDGREERKSNGGFAITSLWDARATPEYLDIDDVVAWRIHDVLASGESPSILAAYTPRPPALDGILDDAAWRQAGALGAAQPHWRHWRGHVGTGDPLRFGRRSWTAYDQDYFYIAMEAEADDPLQLRSSDGNVFEGDCFEAHLRADAEHYVHVGIDVIGQTAEGGMSNVGPLHQVKSYAVVTDRGWVAELAIPWHLFGGKPATPSAWRVNLTGNMAYQGNGKWVPVTATPNCYSVRDAGPGLTLLGETKPTVSAARVDQPIQLDGKLGEAAWALASPGRITGGFVRLDGKPLSRLRTAMLAYNDKHLYIAMRARVDKAESVSTGAHDPDLSDNIRLDFKNQAMGADAAGEALPMILPYQIPFQSKSHIEDGHWTIEMAIPWEHLDGKPEPGSSIPFNIAGHDSVEGPVSWQPLKDFRDLAGFGRLVIGRQAGIDIGQD